MKIENVFLDEYASRIGVVAFGVYIMYRFKGEKTASKDIADCLSITIPTVIKARKVLINCGLMVTKKKAVKSFEIREFKYPEIKSIADIKGKSASSLSSSGDLLAGIQDIKDYYKLIKEKVTGANDIALSNRVKRNISNLIACKINRERLKAMIDWWKKYKMHSIKFNFGIFSCKSIIEEFEKANSGSFKKQAAEEPSEEVVEDSDLLAEVAGEILVKKKKGEKLSEDDVAILKRWKEVSK